MSYPRLPARRRLLLAAAALAAAPLALRAQGDGAIRFLLDGRFDGTSALYLTAAAKGYFKDEGLSVTIDANSGSDGTVARVAAGVYDMACTDFAPLMEFHANNPSAANKPVAVMVVYNSTPAAVLALRRSGIRTPADLSGRKLGAPLNDAGRRAWPIFAKLHNIEGVSWTSVEPAVREALLVRGEVDAITAFAPSALIDLELRGARADDIVVLPYAQHGVKLYGNVIIAGEALLKKSPDAVKAFLRAFTRGVRDVVADPQAGIGHVAQRDGTLDPALELRRLRLTLEHGVLTADARAEGFGDVNGSRLNLMASQVSDAWLTRERVNPNAVWNGSLLPAAGARNIFVGARR